MTQQSTNRMNAFYHGSSQLGKLGKLGTFAFKKNFGKPQLA